MNCQVIRKSLKSRADKNVIDTVLINYKLPF